MKVIGIDVGFTGAVCVMDTDTYKIDEMFVMPIMEVNKTKSRKVRKSEKEYGKQKMKSYVGRHKCMNLHKLNAKLERLSETIKVAYLEQVHSRPGEGVSGAFRFGQGYGNIEALLIANGIEIRYTTPSKWTKHMHKGIAGTIDAKGKSLIIINRLYHDVNFIEDGKRKPHDGLMDATLIARYGAEMENKDE